MDLCNIYNKLNRGIENKCNDSVSNGIEQNAYVIKRSDIDFYTHISTQGKITDYTFIENIIDLYYKEDGIINKNIVNNFYFKTGNYNWKISGTKRVNNSGFMTTINEITTNKFKHRFECVINRSNANYNDMLEQMDDVVVIVETVAKNGDEGTFRIYGIENGLHISENSNNSNENEFTTSLILESKDTSLENKRPIFFYNNNYINTKYMLNKYVEGFGFDEVNLSTNNNTNGLIDFYYVISNNITYNPSLGNTFGVNSKHSVVLDENISNFYYYYSAYDEKYMTKTNEIMVYDWEGIINPYAYDTMLFNIKTNDSEMAFGFIQNTKVGNYISLRLINYLTDMKLNENNKLANDYYLYDLPKKSNNIPKLRVKMFMTTILGDVANYNNSKTGKTRLRYEIYLDDEFVYNIDTILNKAYSPFKFKPINISINTGSIINQLNQFDTLTPFTQYIGTIKDLKWDTHFVMNIKYQSGIVN